MRAFKPFASLRLTVLFLLLLIPAVVIGQYVPSIRAPATALPLALLALNLVAAIIHTPSFRRQLPLMVFHIALLTLVVLSGASVLTSMTGTAELTEGQWFDGRLLTESAGPLHPNRVGRLGFGLARADFGFRPDGSVEWLRADVRVRAPDGTERPAPLSIQKPVAVDGYRIYATPARGFSVVLTWQAHGAASPETGAVHFPPVPADPYRLISEWAPPGSAVPLWMQLQLPSGAQPSPAETWVRPPQDAELVIRTPDGQRLELHQGGTVQLPGGTLRFDELRWWLGVFLHYDWTIPWLLAAAMLAVVSLALHFLRKYRRTGWSD